MRTSTHLTLLALVLTAGVAVAAPSAPSSGRGFSGGTTGARSTSINVARSTPAPIQRSQSTTYRPAASPSTRPIGAMGTTQRRSLLEGRGAKPSPTVTKIIQERESSGPGWIGTAFLISLLSQHDLSASDRSWIQDKIAAVGKEEEQSTGLLPALHPQVKFAFSGLSEPLQSGKSAKIHVSAQDATGKSMPVTCRIPARGADEAPGKEDADLVFTPTAPGVIVMTCAAGGIQEKRMLYVVSASKGG